MKKRILIFFLLIALLLTGLPGCVKSSSTNETALPDAEVNTNIPAEDNNEEPINEATNTTPESSTSTSTSTSTKPNEQQQKPAGSTTSGAQNQTANTTNTNTPDLNAPLNLWVTPVIGKAAKKRPFYAIEWQYNKKDGNYYLYLPTEGKLSAMQVWYAGAATCKFADRPVQNGETVNFLKEGSCTVTLGGQQFSLTVMKSANIGTMYITTESGSMDYIHQKKGNEETGSMRMVDADGNELYNGNLKEIRGRGNATWDKPKKPYQIKLENKAELVAGSGVAGTWLLLANYCEKTMVNNTVALNLAYDAGMTDTVRSAYLDLYCNGEYMGTYQVSEKVQIAESRLNIIDLEKETQKLNTEDLETYSTFGTNTAEKSTSKGYNIPNDPNDITGGYLLEIEANDRYENETAGFVTNGGVAVVIKEPAHPSAAQVAYISKYFQEFEDAIRAEDGINPTTGKRFDQYFDLTSLAKKYILEEYVKNIDADKTSQYFYKPSDTESKVGFCGPVWDYDNSFDVMINATKKDGLYAANQRKKVFYYLCKHDLFMDKVKEYWKSEYLPAIAVCLGEKRDKNASLQSLDYYYKLLTPSAEMNYTLWDNVDTPINTAHVDTGDTYQEHFDYLRDYLTNRRFELNQIWMSQ